ncbi:Organic cation/carnitine transporter 4 [Stylosanthes scabra]|uniref:Organic cation/carnitine transporter 4 n=1 Tax=Stylosanthes scabra TaxID=79078 RepID=A0ABU6SIG3_9FABA|nr:Organic cation/carnitine transporter 4 [Stylosanthes scabra]
MTATTSSDDENKKDAPDPELQSPLIPLSTAAHGGTKPLQKLCFDDMLQMYCGEFGRWQMRHFVLTTIAWALEAFHTMVIIFADHEPNWRCLPDSKCDPTATTVCKLEPGTWEWVGGPRMSTVSEWGLICGNKYMVGLVQAVFFGGCMIGAGIFGHLSDSNLGRKGSLTMVCILNTISGFVTSLAPNYLSYLTLRFLTGFSTGGVGLCAFVLATEPIGPTMRGMAGMSTFYFFSFGIALLSGIAYLFPEWRQLYIATTMPSLLFVLFILPFISESPRWCLVKGRIKEAMAIMSTIATTNGNQLPPGVILALDEDLSSSTGGVTPGIENKEAVSSSLVDIIRSRVTRMRLFLSVAINFVCSVVYYGLSLNVVNLGKNLYLNVILNAIAEMPAFMLTALFLDRLGRKPLTIITLWFSGFFCFLGSLIGKRGAWEGVRIVCSILGIFGMAGTYNLLFVYTAELFPTVVRNVALGCATQASQMGAILAPIVVILGDWWPFVVFTVCGVSGGIFAFYLPETLNQPLYDTLTGMEAAENESFDATTRV